MWGAVYGLDIETDTTELTQEEREAGHTSRGLDPRIGSITSVAVALHGDIVLWQASTAAEERAMLVGVNEYFKDSPPGLVVTWNGAVFDMPYLRDRYAHHQLSGQGPVIAAAHSITPKYEPLPGHEGGYVACWPSAALSVPHSHLDLAYYAKNTYGLDGAEWNLKSFARDRGYAPVELQRDKLHTYSPAEIARYVASDANVTRALALDLLPGLGA